MLFSNLQIVVHKDNNNIIITAGKTASQVFSAWDLEPVKLFASKELTQDQVVDKLRQGCNIDFIIRHPAERYISGFKEIVLNYSLVDMEKLLGRGPKTNINDVVPFDVILSYWHTRRSWEYAIEQVFNFWQPGSSGVKDFSFQNDYHVGNWLCIIQEFIDIANHNNLNNLRIVEVNDIGYYGSKEFDTVFPSHHKSPLSPHVDDIIAKLLSGIPGFCTYIQSEQDIYNYLLNSKYFYRIENNHPRNDYFRHEF